jgi:hypothetical protein
MEMIASMGFAFVLLLMLFAIPVWGTILTIIGKKPLWKKALIISPYALAIAVGSQYTEGEKSAAIGFVILPLCLMYGFVHGGIEIKNKYNSSKKIV